MGLKEWVRTKKHDNKTILKGDDLSTAEKNYLKDSEEMRERAFAENEAVDDSAEKFGVEYSDLGRNLSKKQALSVLGKSDINISSSSSQMLEKLTEIVKREKKGKIGDLSLVAEIASVSLDLMEEKYPELFKVQMEQIQAKLDFKELFPEGTDTFRIMVNFRKTFDYISNIVNDEKTIDDDFLTASFQAGWDSLVQVCNAENIWPDFDEKESFEAAKKLFQKNIEFDISMKKVKQQEKMKVASSLLRKLV